MEGGSPERTPMALNLCWPNDPRAIGRKTSGSVTDKPDKAHALSDHNRDLDCDLDYDRDDHRNPDVCVTLGIRGRW